MNMRDIESMQSNALARRIVLTIGSRKKAESPIVTLKSENFKREQISFVVDTGAEVNLIKRKSVDSNTPVNEKLKITLYGIGPGPVKTMGMIRAKIEKETVEFHVVPNNFAIDQDGLLGMTFLKDQDAVIDIKRGSITSKLGTIPFRRCKTFVIAARSRQVISVPIENADTETGYLPLVTTGIGVFLGENIVRQVDGYAKVYCLNTTTRNVELTIPPLEIEEYEVIKPGPRTARQAEPKSHVPSVNGERLSILLKNIDFNERSVEEKNSILNSIS